MNVKLVFIVTCFNWENTYIRCTSKLCRVLPDMTCSKLSFTQIKINQGNKWEHASYRLPALSSFFFSIRWSQIAQFRTNLLHKWGGVCGEEVKEGHFLFFLTKLHFCFQESCLTSVPFYLLSVKDISYTKYFQKLFTACSSSNKRISNSSSMWSPSSRKDVIMKKCVSWQPTYVYFNSVYLVMLYCVMEIKCFLVLQL